MEYVLITLMTIAVSTLLVYLVANQILKIAIRLKTLLVCAACAVLISVVLPRFAVGVIGLSGTFAVLLACAILFAYVIAYHCDKPKAQTANDVADDIPLQAALNDDDISPVRTAARKSEFASAETIAPQSAVVADEPATEEDASLFVEIPLIKEKESQVEEEPPVVAELPTIEEEELPVVAELPTIEEEELPVVAELPTIEEEELPVVAETPTIEEEEPPVVAELPMIEEEELPVVAETPTIEEEELPVVAETPTIEEEELPVVAETPTIEEEELPVVAELPTIEEEEPPVVAELPTIEEEELQRDLEKEIHGDGEKVQLDMSQWEELDVESLWELALTYKDDGVTAAALGCFRAILRRFADSELVSLAAIEAANILKNDGLYDEAISLFSEVKLLPAIRGDESMEQEFIVAIAYLRIVKNVLVQNRLGFMPFRNIPEPTMQEIEEEFREWRKLA